MVSDDAIAIVPHPTDVKGKWLGIAEAQTAYSPEATAPLLASFETMKHSFLQSPDRPLLLAPLAESLQTEWYMGALFLGPLLGLGS